jgi:DNA-binding response OmpR family regulator
MSGQETLRGRRVLVVEDEALVAMELEYKLEAAGAVVYGPAASLPEAIAAAEEEHLEAAILDVDLGGLDVFPVADMLKARGVPFLFYTGHGRRTALAGDYPDAPVCQKPLSSDEVLRVLAKLL